MAIFPHQDAYRVVEKLDLRGMGDRIRLERTRRKITQKQLAEDAGVALPTIANLELGKPQGLSVGTLVSIADALGNLSLDFLVYGEGHERRQGRE